MTLLICNIQNKKGMNKQNKAKLIYTDNILVVTRGKRYVGRVKWVKGVKCTVMNGDETFGGEHTIMYTDTGAISYT